MLGNHRLSEIWTFGDMSDATDDCPRPPKVLNADYIISLPLTTTDQTKQLLRRRMPTSYLQKLKDETDTLHHCSSLSALPESATSTSAGLDFRSVAGGTDGRGTVRDEEGPFWTGKLFDELARRWSSALRARALPTASESHGT